MWPNISSINTIHHPPSAPAAHFPFLSLCAPLVTMEPFPAIPIANGVAIVLVLLPISWHWKARNIGTLLYIGWTVLGNLNWLINTIVWRGTWEDLAPRWCDICTCWVFWPQSGMRSVGLTAASLCINRKLYNIATIQSVTRSPKSCVYRSSPLQLITFLDYVVQPTRYNIIENIGCWPKHSIGDTFDYDMANHYRNCIIHLLRCVLVYVGPSHPTEFPLGLAIRAFLKARQQFNQVLNNSGSGVNMSRYFRLMALATEEMLFTLPFAIYILVMNLTQAPMIPWISWEDTHQDYNTIWKTPWILMKASQQNYNTMMINLWVLPAGGFLFFVWFGLGGEAIASYKAAFYKVAGLFGIKPKPKTAPASRWQNQLVSNTSSVPTRDNARFSLPDLNEVEGKRSSEEDLEAAKIRLNWAEWVATILDGVVLGFAESQYTCHEGAAVPSQHSAWGWGDRDGLRMQMTSATNFKVLIPIHQVYEDKGSGFGPLVICWETHNLSLF
ncbi:STE3 domain-containing protein [Rhizoctonia solani AG-1 IA]|uniref:STE3 domain-containing protein n=1 Tax=Thanatephorus cucumeris (strain AG1-IA) TaxID=983506 RepID=L8WFI2_THACA|nr:STE3 domain-containing protein [Rhizoctonia solani AG-1 IA]